MPDRPGGDGRAQFGADASGLPRGRTPSFFLEALDQPGLAQKLEVARTRGWLLAHDLDQLCRP